MNYYNRINEILDEMTDDIKYIKKRTFVTLLKKN
jgi:hypothetical protein